MHKAMRYMVQVQKPQYFYFIFRINIMVIFIMQLNLTMLYFINFYCNLY